LVKELLNLDDQIVTSQTPAQETTVQRTVWFVLVGVMAMVILGLALLFRQPDPYVQEVLTRPGDALQGQVIFQLNCAGCHGFDANGLVGPSLHHVASRKTRTGLIHQVTSGETPPMPQFQPSPQEMADLLEYLQRL
jgi:mono/diheme cytochrome c family protein